MTINGFNPNNPRLRGYNTIRYLPVPYQGIESGGEPKQGPRDELLPAGGIVAGIAGVLRYRGFWLRRLWLSTPVPAESRRDPLPSLHL